MMDEHAFVFISGLHRSGKSLLAQHLGEHPDISTLFNPDYDGMEGYDEGQHAPQSVYRSDKAFGGPGSFGHCAEVHMDETHSASTKASGRQLFEVWKPYWNLSCPFLLETSPPNLLRTRFLQAIFPETYFICVLRHPIAVSYETADKCVEKPRPRLDQLLEHWLFCNEQFEQDCSHLENVHIVKYELLVAQPQATLDGVYDFLGVDPLPIISRMRPNANERYFRRWLSPSSQFGDILPFKKMLRVYCRFRFEKRMNAFGYSLKSAPERYVGVPSWRPS